MENVTETRSRPASTHSAASHGKASPAPPPSDAVSADAGRRARVLEVLLARQRARDASAAAKAAAEREARTAYPIWARSADATASKQERQAALAEEIAAKQVQECTFAPTINEKSRSIAGTRRQVRPRAHTRTVAQRHAARGEATCVCAGVCVCVCVAGIDNAHRVRCRQNKVDARRQSHITYVPLAHARAPRTHHACIPTAGLCTWRAYVCVCVCERAAPARCVCVCASLLTRAPLHCAAPSTPPPPSCS